MGDYPFVGVFLLILIITVPPALLIGFLFGRRGLERTFLFLGLSMLIYFVWVFGISDKCCPTGMEGLALIVFPSMFMVSGIVTGFCYLILAVLKLFPDQRGKS